MIHFRRLGALVLVYLLFGNTLAAQDLEARYEDVPASAELVSPIAVGDTLPRMILKDAFGSDIDLNEAVSRQPTILIFYRGGWCPYCNMHLGRLATIEGDLREMGFQILAISPDLPEKLRTSIDKHDLDYTLLSDSDMTASIALGIAFRVDDETVERYLTRGIDLEGDSGHDHHLLPVPAAFVVNTDGVVGFSYVNPNYRLRIENDALMQAASSTQ